MEFKKFKRSQIAEMRPVTQDDISEFHTVGELRVPDSGEPVKRVSISDFDLSNGSPKLGDMIARNPKSHTDQWLVAEEYFKDNFEAIK